MDYYFKLNDSLFKKNNFVVYIQNYYPTDPIIKALEENSSFIIILPNYTRLKNIFKYRRIHYSNNLVSQKIVLEMIEKYKQERSLKWSVDDLIISDYLNEIIESNLSKHLLRILNQAESTEQNMKSFNRNYRKDAMEFNIYFILSAVRRM